MLSDRLWAYPAILLAGGQSSRMGCPKGLLDHDGEPWIVAQLRALSKAEVREVVVVLGHGHEAYRPVLDACRDPDLTLTVVVNREPGRGMFSSLVCAAEAVLARGYAKGAFVLPVDVPAPGIEVWAGLALSMTAAVEVAQPEQWGSAGHPVLLSRAFLTRCLESPLDSPDARLDRMIERTPAHAKRRLPVTDGRIRLNLNDAKAWSAFRERQSGASSTGSLPRVCRSCGKPSRRSRRACSARKGQVRPMVSRRGETGESVPGRSCLTACSRRGSSLRSAPSFP